MKIEVNLLPGSSRTDSAPRRFEERFLREKLAHWDQRGQGYPQAVVLSLWDYGLLLDDLGVRKVFYHERPLHQRPGLHYWIWAAGINVTKSAHVQRGWALYTFANGEFEFVKLYEGERW